MRETELEYVKLLVLAAVHYYISYKYDALGNQKIRKSCILKYQISSPVTVDTKGTCLRGIQISLSEDSSEEEEKRILYEDELEALGYVCFESGTALSGGSSQTEILGDPVKFKVEQSLLIFNESLLLCGSRVTVNYDLEGFLQEVDVIRFVPSDTLEYTGRLSQARKTALVSDFLVEGVGQPESFAAFCATPKLQSGRWIGEGTALFPYKKEAQTVQSLCKFVADISGFSVLVSETLSSGREEIYGLHLGKRDANTAIGFTSSHGRTYEARLVLLGGGLVLICPTKLPKDESFFVEVSWLVDEFHRKRLVRHYDEQGRWDHSSFINEVKQAPKQKKLVFNSI
eukprot:jgi/Galph1/2750/GphlegSOOS_G1392.1